MRDGFHESLQQLLQPLDPTRHRAAVAALSQCRNRGDLDAIVDGGGWLGPEVQGKRLKLVRHASGTYLVVEYDDGWSSRLSQAGFS